MYWKDGQAGGLDSMLGEEVNRIRERRKVSTGDQTNSCRINPSNVDTMQASSVIEMIEMKASTEEVTHIEEERKEGLIK